MGIKPLHKIADVQKIAARGSREDEGSELWLGASERPKVGASLIPERSSQEAGAMNIQAMFEQFNEQMNKNSERMEGHAWCWHNG